MAKSWSKRKTLHHKHKVEKKVREHHRQVRRDSKKNGGSSSGRSRKDPGIPNLFPHKAALMDALNTRREEETAASAAARLERRAANKAAAAAAAAGGGGDPQLAALAAAAAQRAAAHTPTEGLGAGASDGVGGTVPASSSAAGRSGGSGGGLAAAAAAGTETSRRAFMAHFRSVVDAADVLLQVLDARDPLGTRSAEVERAVLGATPPKRLVLILNKVDLVPRAVADTWLRVLRCDYPTVAFRASTQQQRRGLGQSGGDALDAGSAGGALCAGAGALLSLLKTYGRTRGSGKGVASSIAVGVVGYPNVGKSSVVNSLARSRVAAVGATPGVTRNLQEVHLDAHVRLIDCPGIVFAPPPPAGGGGDGDGGDAAADFSASLVLRASVSPQNTPDPEGAVAALLARVGPAPLMAAYTLPAFEDAPTFLALLAKRRGKVTSGGVLDVKAAAVAVLVEWNAGKVPFYTLPPAGSAGAGASPASGAAVVAAWGNDFDVSAVNVMTDGRPDPGGDVAMDVSAADRARYTALPSVGGGDAQATYHLARPDGKGGLATQ